MVHTWVMVRTERERNAGRMGDTDTEVETPAGGLDRSREVAELTEVDGLAPGRPLRLHQ